MNLISKIFNICINETTGLMKSIHDRRYHKNINICDSLEKFGSISYTIKSDDISKMKKPFFTPYTSKEAAYDSVIQSDNTIICINSDIGVETIYLLDDISLRIHTFTDNIEISEFGINLPMNFMGKKGGEWTSQFLVSSPYVSHDNHHIFIFFTRPDGNHLLITIKNEIDGFKIDYSEYIAGHFFINIKFLSSFDKAYNTKDKKEKILDLDIRPVQTYSQAIDIVSEILSLPVAYYNVSSAFIGQSLPIKVKGDWDYAKIISPNNNIKKLVKTDQSELSVLLEEYGIYNVIPYFNDKIGLDCTIFAIDNWKDYYTRATNSVIQDYGSVKGFNLNGEPMWEPPSRYDISSHGLDSNLCESGIWAVSALRYMRLYGYDEKLAGDVKNLISFIMTDKPDLYIERLSMPAHRVDGIESYNTYKSTRIQEAFNGVTILTDAYKLFDDDSYLEYAVAVMQSMLKNYLMASGEIRRFSDIHTHDKFEDYTTVTCLVIAVADLANLLRGNNDSRYAEFENAAIKIADYVVKRGLIFPTEGGVVTYTEAEMEDGSISCTALTALYVARFIRYDKKYVDFAGEILKWHDAWSIYTHDARMFRSSLRWWETIWEGDSDGPAICCGHPWTIWRAEAEFHYAIMVHDTKRLIDSYNAYMSNFSKADKDGVMYSIYQCEYMPGGGFTDKCEDISFKNHRGLPNKPDNSISRYVFERAYDSWFRCMALLNTKDFNGILNGNIVTESGCIVVTPYSPMLEMLYTDGFKGLVKIKTNRTIKILSDILPEVINGENSWVYETLMYVTPLRNEIVLKYS